MMSPTLFFVKSLFKIYNNSNVKFMMGIQIINQTNNFNFFKSILPCTQVYSHRRLASIWKLLEILIQHIWWDRCNFHHPSAWLDEYDYHSQIQWLYLLADLQQSKKYKRLMGNIAHLTNTQCRVLTFSKKKCASTNFISHTSLPLKNYIFLYILAWFHINFTNSCLHFYEFRGNFTCKIGWPIQLKPFLAIIELHHN